MANAEHVDVIKKGVEHWNKWRQSEKTPEGPDIDLRGADLRFLDGEGIDLSGVMLDGADFSAAKLAGADLRGASANNASFTKATIAHAVLSNGHFHGASFNSANMESVNLSHADLSAASMDAARLDRADLRGADMSFANIASATLEGIKVDGETALEMLRVGNMSALFREHERTIDIAVRDRYLNWSILRFIGQFPLFGVSWTALIVSLISVNTIGLLNETQFLEFIDYPIPIPHRMTLIIVGSLLLVTGSTLYAWVCPRRVQHFSETGWVEEHENARLHYLAASLSKRRWQWPTFIATAVGGLIAVWLVVERIMIAFRYIL